MKIVQTSANVKNTIPFTYTDKDLEKKPDIDEQLKSMDEAQLEDLLIATAKQFSRINLKSNEEKTRHSDSGKFHLKLKSITKVDNKVNKAQNTWETLLVVATCFDSITVNAMTSHAIIITISVSIIIIYSSVSNFFQNTI